MIEEFNCGCEEWIIQAGDSVVIRLEEMPPDMREWVYVHSCDVVAVYRKFKSVKKLIYKKQNDRGGKDTMVQERSNSSNREIQGETNNGNTELISQVDDEPTLPGGTPTVRTGEIEDEYYNND